MNDVSAAVTGEALAAIALEAGALIMGVYEREFDVAYKDDRSPVTLADQAAETLILRRLAELAPDLVVVAEEDCASGALPEVGEIFALVDPLDGTKEFVARSHEFTVNIAIIENGRPVRGVVYAPARGKLYVADAPGTAWAADLSPDEGLQDVARRALHVRAAPEAGLTAVASRSHRTPETDAYLDKFPIAELRSAGSSLKFCLVADGEADLYPRMGRTMEWDTAAGHAIVQAAGGAVVTLDDVPLSYGKRSAGFANPHFVVRGWR